MIIIVVIIIINIRWIHKTVIEMMRKCRVIKKTAHLKLSLASFLVIMVKSLKECNIKDNIQIRYKILCILYLLKTVLF